MDGHNGESLKMSSDTCKMMQCASVDAIVSLSQISIADIESSGLDISTVDGESMKSVCVWVCVGGRVSRASLQCAETPSTPQETMSL